jgi:hypothetical protein
LKPPETHSLVKPKKSYHINDKFLNDRKKKFSSFNK